MLYLCDTFVKYDCYDESYAKVRKIILILRGIETNLIKKMEVVNIKKLYIFGLVSILALSLLLAGCGKASKSGTTQPDQQSVKQSQDMKDSSHDMSTMDHSKM